jgi:aarF domain-containing kinase
MSLKLQVQRPGIEPIIYRDLFLFRTLASFLNGISLQKLGCNAELIVDEFGEKLLEELDYTLVSIFVAFNCHCQFSKLAVTAVMFLI